MSNLSELLPTGGGQNAVDFVASGTLSSGQTVALKSDGTVEAVAETVISVSLGTSVAIGDTIDTPIATAYDSTNNKVVIAYADKGNSLNGTAVVATVSGSTLTFGTPVVFSSSQVNYIAATFDSVNGKVVIPFLDVSSAGDGRCVVGTVSGTGISFGNAANFESGQPTFNSATYDSANEKVVIAFKDSSPYKCVVGTVSGTSISFGTAVEFETGSTGYCGISYDSTNEKVVVAFKDTGNSNYGTAIVGTVSGTSISFGSQVVFASANSSYVGSAYDSYNQKTLITYKQASPAGVYSIVGTVSGTSISFGSASAATTNSSEYVNFTYDNTAQAIVVCYWDTTAGQGSVQIGTVSGTSITYGSAIQLVATQVQWNSLAYDASAGKTVIAYANPTDNGFAAVLAAGGSSTNNTSFIGITAGAISNAATGKVNVYGGINKAQSSLTIASDYYVQADGSLSTATSTVKAGQAISATTINMKDLT